MGGFEQGFQFGAGQAENAAAQKSSLDMLQRQFLASQYDNLINAPLPDQSKDPEGYQKALDSKAKALEARQKVYSPDHHANLFDSIHALITGKQQGAQPNPPQPAAPQHPFQSNPMLSKFDEGIQALGRHLKAAAHPIATKAGPDWQSLAAAPGPQDVALASEKRRQDNALAIEKAKAEDAKTLSESKKRPQLKPFMISGKMQWLDASDPTKLPEGAEAINTFKPKDSQAALATYIRAKYGENPTAEQIAEGTREHQKMMAGTTVGSHQSVQYDSDGIPHIVTLTSVSGKQFPTSSASPQVPDSMAGPNARLNAKKPISKQVPTNTQTSQLDFRKATPSSTKAKQAVDTAENSYLDVQKASQDPTPVGDQGVILAWLRGRVNRVTNTEIQAVNNLGGATLKMEGNAVRILTGKMTDQQRQWFLRSAKDNYDNAKTVASKYGSPSSSQSPPNSNVIVVKPEDMK
jgi:hypothetical protein